MRRTKEQAAETKATILQCAEDLFIEKGYDNVPMEDIATAANVTRGAIHWHFVNKEGLLAEIRHKSSLPLLELADQLQTDNESSPFQLLGDAICKLFADLQDDERKRALVRVTVHYEMSRPPDSASNGPHEAFTRVVERILEVAQQRGKLKPIWTGRTAALWIAATVSGVIEEWALERSELTLEPLGQMIVREQLSALQIS